jgi:hypothetical protein
VVEGIIIVKGEDKAELAVVVVVVVVVVDDDDDDDDDVDAFRAVCPMLGILEVKKSMSYLTVSGFLFGYSK